MNDVQKEICLELMSHANNKTEVKNVMNETFKTLNKKELNAFINESWKKRKIASKISMRILNYKEKRDLLQSLLNKKQNGEIKHIYVTINKCLSKETPFDMYKAMIGAKNLYVQRRELQRGSEVELLRFDENGIKILIEDLNWKGYEFYFLVYDINCCKYIRIE
jgi:hypothetical protein